jgi:two-component system response regulator YesN
MITGIDYRCNQIKASEKPVAELAKEYVDSAYKEDISLNDVAERLFISKEYLSSTFKSHFGITLGNYVLKKKMEEAARLLSEGATHKAISDELGYNDVTYFYKVFKRYYGCTPGEYGN